MTVDALLNILLSVVVPGLMAVIGGVLAARALPSEPGKRNPEVWMWTSGFILLFVVGVVLAFIQQVRSTREEQVREYNAHQTELRSSGDLKYMQGQLDSINRVLAEVSNNSDPKQTAAILKSLVPASRPSTEKPTADMLCRNLENCPNSELRKRALDAANSIEGIYNEWYVKKRDDYLKNTDQAGLTNEEREKQAQNFQQSMKGWSAIDMGIYREKYQSDAYGYRQEMIRRLGPGAHDSSTDLYWDLVARPNLPFGIDNLSEITAELRNLAGQLPQTP